MSSGAYDKDVVFAWLKEHAQIREDGRVERIGRTKLAETYRDTIDRWRANDNPLVPMERWDEILVRTGHMLYEFELWATEHYGFDGYQLQET